MKRPAVKWFLPLLVIAAALAVVVVMMATREPPSRADAGETPARLVRTQAVERTAERIEVRATGTVMPARAVDLQPQVSGRVIAVHDDLQPGAVIPAGETLVTIEPTDFEAAVAEAEGQLARARADLALEKGRSEVAAAEFETYARELDVPVDESLARRRPQLESAEAAVRQAAARLRRARADLARTTIEAPFDVLIQSESVDVGAQVGPQTQLARLVAVDRYWVRATLPMGHLPFLAVPGYNAEKGSTAIVEQDTGSHSLRREGRVLRLYGGVTDQGRLAQVLVEVPDPTGRQGDSLPLLLGTFVDVRLRSPREREVIKLPRAYLHERDTVWVFADGRLDIREVEVVWRAPGHVLIDGGLAPGERVVTSPINHPVQGLRLKRADGDDA
ncbi:RND family efflux transporter MFP subunit [Salinisphaera sp. PC39]|uniref:efflux RND transporter periplasmic adaptor subunit n=1 Tax=Salinisphaera sp. PC39 TaxID=1304156 RepID=UPI00333E92F5